MSLRFGIVANTSRANASRSVFCAGPPGATATKIWGSHAGRGFCRRLCRRVAQHDRASRDDPSDPKSRELGDLERQQAQLLLDRYDRADGERRQHGADRGVGIVRLGRVRDLHGDERGQCGERGHQNPFADLRFLDLLPPDHQESLAGRKRHRLARLERHALPLERIGGHGLVQVRVGLAGKRDQDDGDAVARVLEAEKTLARHHSGRRREPDAGAGRIGNVGRARRRRGEHECDEEQRPADHDDCILLRLDGGKYGVG